MSIPFRTNRPERTYSGPNKKSYRDYKEILRLDFNKKCGYTDCSDFWFGGKTNFHIDHFIPVSKAPNLETEYENLVYTCSFVNRAKSNIQGDFLDPCKNDYNEHFYRDNLGNIIPKEDSIPAKFMYTNLKLYLHRYSIIWMLEFIREKIKSLSYEISKITDANNRKELLELYFDLSTEFQNYLDYLEIEND